MKIVEMICAEDPKLEPTEVEKEWRNKTLYCFDAYAGFAGTACSELKPRRLKGLKAILRDNSFAFLLLDLPTPVLMLIAKQAKINYRETLVGMFCSCELGTMQFKQMLKETLL